MHDLPIRPLVVACLTAWLLSFGLAGGPSLPAQEPAAETELPEPEAAQAETPQAETAKPRRPFANALATAVGTRRYAPNKWGIVAVDLYNPTDQPAEFLVTSYLNHDQGLQFGRRMWVPAGTRRASWYPIKVPPIADPQRDSVDVGSLLEILSQPGPDQGSGQQVVARRSESGLMLDRGNVVSGLVLDRDPNPLQISWPYETVIAARACQQQSRQLALLESGPLPPTPEALDALHQLVVASDRVAEDAAAMRAIRTWLVRGGRLWLMLDQLSPEVAARLAGDHLAWQEVDRVGLTTIHVEGTEAVPYLKDEMFELEQPETLVRVLATGARVSHTLDGWPAAFWLDVGRGQVLVTTVGPRAWVRRRTGADPRPRSVLQDTNYYPRPPLEQLAGEFFAPPQPELFERGDTMPYLSEQIGYRTLPRPVLAAILGSFCLLVLGGAAWFARRGRGELLAAGVAVSAVLVTALIAGLGSATRSAVPQSVASFQLLDAVPDQSELNVVGSLGLYNPTSLDEPLGSEGGGLLWPDMDGLEGTTRRLIFSDLDRFAWDNLRLPPGVRLAAVETTAPLSGSLQAWASFQESGLQGQLRAADAVELSDAVIATPSGRLLAVRIDADGRFEATAAGVFVRGQYSAEALLSDEGRRRRDIYARLLAPERIDRLIRRPSLLVWAAARPLPLRLPSEAEQRGASLLVVPLHWEPSAAGAQVTVPSPLVGMRSVVGPQGQALSSCYNNLRRQWLTQSGPADVHLRFSVPPPLRAMRVEQATLRLDLNCPSRQLDIVGFDESREPAALGHYSGPVGRVTLRIREPGVLRLDEHGGLLLALYVDRQGLPDNDTSWLIEDAQLELTGRMPDELAP